MPVVSPIPCSNLLKKSSRCERSRVPMQRREFLAGIATAAGLVGTTQAASAVEARERAVNAQDHAVEFYELRQYHLQMGAKPKIVDDYWRDAALPALKRLGIGPVGVFNVLVGPESPTLYVLIPHKTAESGMKLPARL